MITAENTIQRNPEMLASKMDQEYVMMSIENGEYYGLNEVAGRIWELTENKVKVADIVAQLMEEFDVSEEQCMNEVTDFLEQLEDKKLIFLV